jgi:O-antigen biosynthesis protein WbqP
MPSRNFVERRHEGPARIFRCQIYGERRRGCVGFIIHASIWSPASFLGRDSHPDYLVTIKRPICSPSMKRSFDIVVSIFGLAICGWLILVLSLAIRASSAGPGIFVQERVGRDQKRFMCYKLRTMFVDTPAVATHQTTIRSVTPLGRHLRRLKLDELPQLWNVLRGEMSLVGPRPCLPSQKELIEARAKRGVFGIRPGITGKAQVLGMDMSDPEKLAIVDGEYAARQSFVRDVILLVQTALGTGGGDRIRTDAR